jgi:hypothetical protein
MHLVDAEAGDLNLFSKKANISSIRFPIYRVCLVARGCRECLSHHRDSHLIQAALRFCQCLVARMCSPMLYEDIVWLARTCGDMIQV